MVVEDGTGKTNSDSYCSVDTADTYHTTARLYSTDWTGISTTAEKETALIWATRVLDDEMNWYGTIVSETQALRWPRTGVITRDGVTIEDNEMPTSIQYAVAELAMHLTAEDRTTDSYMTGVEDVKAGPIRVKIKQSWSKSVIPRSVYKMVKQYGVITQSQKTLYRM